MRKQKDQTSQTRSTEIFTTANYTLQKYTSLSVLLALGVCVVVLKQMRAFSTFSLSRLIVSGSVFIFSANFDLVLVV